MSVEIDFPVEFIVAGTPLSRGNTRSRAAWQETVKQASYAALPEGHFAFEGEPDNIFQTSRPSTILASAMYGDKPVLCVRLANDPTEGLV
jgi:hypothetical protein